MEDNYWEKKVWPVDKNIITGVGTPFDIMKGQVVYPKATKTPLKIQVYVDTGNVFEYEVGNEAKAREHAAAIIATGYRSVNEDDPLTLTWFPPHRINKVVVKLNENSTTKYFDKVLST
jgi:hypothetical protein